MLIRTVLFRRKKRTSAKISINNNPASQIKGTISANKKVFFGVCCVMSAADAADCCNDGETVPIPSETAVNAEPMFLSDGMRLKLLSMENGRISRIAASDHKTQTADFGALYRIKRRKIIASITIDADILIISNLLKSSLKKPVIMSPPLHHLSFSVFP